MRGHFATTKPYSLKTFFVYDNKTGVPTMVFARRINEAKRLTLAHHGFAPGRYADLVVNRFPDLDAHAAKQEPYVETRPEILRCGGYLFGLNGDRICALCGRPEMGGLFPCSDDFACAVCIPPSWGSCPDIYLAKYP